MNRATLRVVVNPKADALRLFRCVLHSIAFDLADRLAAVIEPLHVSAARLLARAIDGNANLNDIRSLERRLAATLFSAIAAGVLPMTTAAELAARHGLKRQGRDWRGRCPACGYDGGLTLTEKAGRPLWWCASCRDQDAVSAALLGSAPAPRSDAPERRQDNGADRRGAALAVWNLAAPGGLVPAYLVSRSLPQSPADVLRYLAAAKHPSGARLPCMVARLDDVTGKPVAVHRTFLAPAGAGKAAVEPARMTLGAVRGAVVRLYPAAPRMVIAEGIETALAAAVILKAPAWAATSAGNLADTLALPDLVREVVIAADNDEPGRAAARQAASRWRREGRAVRIATPETAGADFNDLLRERLRNG